MAIQELKWDLIVKPDQYFKMRKEFQALTVNRAWNVTFSWN